MNGRHMIGAALMATVAWPALAQDAPKPRIILRPKPPVTVPAPVPAPPATQAQPPVPTRSERPPIVFRRVPPDAGAPATPPVATSAPSAGARPPMAVRRPATGTTAPVVAAPANVRPSPLDQSIAAPPVAARTPVVVAGAGLGAFSAGPADRLVPPTDIVSGTRPGAVLLRPGSADTVVQALPAIRRLSAKELRSNSRIVVGRTRVDFRPLLENPKALLNIASRMRAKPQLLEVRADEFEAREIAQGLAIRNILTYRLKPGACSTAARRAEVAATGINCYAPQSPAQRAAAFANPKDARYVADPGERAKALAAAQSQAAVQAADIEQSVAALRQRLANSAQRAELVAALGSAEVDRLAALDNSALTGEMVNTSETKIEQVAFVPKDDKVDQAPAPANAPNPTAPPKPPADVDVAYDIGQHVFLTGFTLGRDYEWRQRVETTIAWCLLGCKKTYYAEVWAGFGYAFGLRFPLRLGGSFRYQRVNGAQSAAVTTSLATIDGTANDYLASGLSPGRTYDGKEFVAQIEAWAGFKAKLPLHPVFAPPELRLKVDFTDYLGSPYAGGQMKPPMPGKPSPAYTQIFDQVDLIGGRANLGIVGAKVFPAVKVELVSNEMGATLRDRINGNTVTLPRADPIALAISPADGSSSFVVEKPVYNIGFLITPGLNARLFIDLAVWGTHYDWPVWLPQLAIEVPKGGVTFACHADTVCAREFRYTDKGRLSEFKGQLNQWAYAFDRKFMPQCRYEKCRQAVRFITQATVGLGNAKEKSEANFGKAMGIHLFKIDEEATQVVFSSNLDGWAKDFEDSWLPQCATEKCRGGIRLLKVGTLAAGKQKVFPRAMPRFEEMKAAIDEAEATAAKMVAESKPKV